MTINSIDESQRRAAKVVGFVYLFAMAASMFAELYLFTGPGVFSEVPEDQSMKAS